MSGSTGRWGSPFHNFNISLLHHFTFAPFHHFIISPFHHYNIAPLPQVAQKKGKGMKEIANRMDSVKFNAVLVEKANNPWNLIYIATAVIVHKNQEVVLSPCPHCSIAPFHHFTNSPLHHCPDHPDPGHACQGHPEDELQRPQPGQDQDLRAGEEISPPSFWSWKPYLPTGWKGKEHNELFSMSSFNLS